MSQPTNYDIAKIVRDLLVIAKVAMPAHVYEQDRRVQSGQTLLDALNASQHRPPSVSKEPFAPFIGEADPLDPWAQHILNGLNAFPLRDIEVSKGIDAFLAEEASPTTQPEAIEHILRDWLTGHGYIEHRASEDPFH